MIELLIWSNLFLMNLGILVKLKRLVTLNSRTSLTSLISLSQSPLLWGETLLITPYSLLIATPLGPYYFSIVSVFKIIF